MTYRSDEHLGELAAALVDGALGHNVRDCALAHLTACAACREEVDAQRRLKSALSAAPDPQPPFDLTSRLLDIARVSTDHRSDDARGAPLPWMPQMASFVAPTAASLAPGAGRVRRGSRPQPGPDDPHRRPRRTRRVTGRVAGGITALAFGVAVVILTVPRDQPISVAPQVSTYTVEHASTTGGLPGADPAAGAVVMVSSRR